MNAHEIQQIQQTLFKLWLNSPYGDRGNYLHDPIDGFFYTAQRSGEGFQLKNIPGNRDKEILIKQSSGYYNTWLCYNKGHILICTAIRRFFGGEPSRLIKSWRKLCEKNGFYDFSADSGPIYHGIKTIAYSFYVQGGLRTFAEAAGGWGEICKEYEEKKLDYEQMIQKHNGMYRNTQERVNALQERIHTAYNSEIWGALKAKIADYKSHTYNVKDTSYSLSSKGVYITYHEKYYNDGDSTILYSFNDLGYKDLGNADDLVSFAVALFCVHYNIEIADFWEKATWNAEVKEIVNKQDVNNEIKWLVINNPILKTDTLPKEPTPLKDIF